MAQGNSWRDREEFCADVLSSLVTVKLVSQFGKDEAATRLQMSVPAVNKRLDRIAKCLGVSREQLFNAQKGGRPTELGNQIVALADAVEECRKPFVTEISRLLEIPIVLRVAILQSVWDVSEAKIREAYRKMLEDKGMKGEITAKLVLNGAVFDEETEWDVAVGYEPPDLPKTFARELWRREPMVLAVPKDMLPSRRRRVDDSILPSEIDGLRRATQGKRFYTMQSGAPMWKLVEGYLRDNEIDMDRVEPRPSVSDVLERVGSNSGISILPEGSIAKDHRRVLALPLAGTVNRRDGSAKPLERKLVIIYRRQSNKANEIRMFRHILMRDPEDPYLATG